MFETLNGDSVKIARAYMDSLLIEGRVIGAGYPSTETMFFGEKFETPIMTAALSHLKCEFGNGMALLAEGAKKAGAAACIGMSELPELRMVLETGARVIRIIKPYDDPKEIRDRIELCEKMGAMAVGMDLEHAAEVSSAENSTVLGFPMKQVTMDELKEYVSGTKLPFVVKGVLSVHDAVRCAEAGCKGIVLSHHNGMLRWAVPPIMALGEIRKAVGKDMLIILDGGIENGYDAFKALALGADAVSVGRALMPPLEKNGSDGVKDKLLAMNNELKAAMLRTDSKDVYSIDPAVIRRVY